MPLKSNKERGLIIETELVIRSISVELIEGIPVPRLLTKSTLREN